MLPAAVPDFEMQCLDLGLVGYRMIRGKPLDDRLLQRFADEVGTALGEFLARLHGFDSARANALGAPVNPLGGYPHNTPLQATATAEENGWRDVIAHAKSEVSSGLKPHVGSQVVTGVEAVFDAVLDDPAALDFLPTLVHTELNPEHTLFGDDGRLVGVIDWSDACISDPAVDIALALVLPPRAAAALIDAYGAQPDAAVQNRVRVFQTFGAYCYLLHGQATQDDTITAAAVDRLNTLIR